MPYTSRMFTLLFLFPLGCEAQREDECPDASVANVWDSATLPDVEAIPADKKAAPVSKPGPSGDRPLRHVWLLDHSGSMYANYVPPGGHRESPFYVEVPEFRNFVTTELAANFQDGKDSAALLVFNEHAYGWDGNKAQMVENGSGPKFADLQVATKADLADRLSKLPPPPYGTAVAGLPAPRPRADNCSVVGAAANCSKMLVGLNAAKALLDEDTGEGMIWLVTDNIYDGGTGSSALNKSEIDENKAFYQSLKDTPEYRVVVAYPVVHGTAGAWIGNTSLFVYGIYYDRDMSRKPTVDEVRRLLGDTGSGVLASAALTQNMKGYASTTSPSPGRPFRFKPLDQDVVRISLAADVEQVTKHAEMGELVKLKAKIKVQNLLDHRIIDSMTFTVTNAKWAGYEPNNKATKGEELTTINPVCPGKFKSELVTVTGLAPGEERVVEVPLTMPGVDYTIMSGRGLLQTARNLLQIASNDYVVMGGALQAKLTDVTSHMSIDPAEFQGTYGAESLPDIFRNPTVGNYTAQFVGKTQKIENPGTVMAMLALAATAAAAILLAIGSFMLTSVSRRVVIDGTDRGAVSIPRLRSRRIERGSEVIANASLGLGGTISLRGTGGYVASRQGDAWTLTKSGGSTIRVELRNSRK